jgi:dienelactone hydrolase
MAGARRTARKGWLRTAPVASGFEIPLTTGSWQQKRRVVRRTLWKLLGELPERPPAPRVQTLSRKDRGDYFVEKFQFDNKAGAIVPGYLLLPKRVKGKAPAILYCHYHGGDYGNGKEEIFKRWPAGEQPGPTLAKRGFVVLAIDAYCFGERRGRGPGGAKERGVKEELSASKFNLWIGRTLWGMMLRDDLMALDYLLSRPEVEKRRVGVTGMSMGATRSWWLMALDERIRAGVAVACLTRYRNLIEQQALNQHGIYYYVPGMLNHFDTEAVVSLIAPRPALFLNGDRDAGSPVEGIREIAKVVRKAYRLYGTGPKFASVVYKGVGHDYTPVMWKRMLGWMEGQLKCRT